MKPECTTQETREKNETKLAAICCSSYGLRIALFCFFIRL